MFLKRVYYASASVLVLALAYHLGAQTASAHDQSTAPEVVVLSGVVDDGGTIPLPTFTDGTVADESECQWIVSPHWVWGLAGSAYFTCFTHDGRQVEVHANGGGGPSQANFMIIGIRTSTPTPVQGQTWGATKAKYRIERSTAQSQNR